MRKNYVKPQVSVENYCLSEMVSSCDLQVTFSTSTGCANNIPTDVDSIINGWHLIGIFANGENGCSQDPGSDAMFDGKTCYYQSASNSVFSS